MLLIPVETISRSMESRLRIAFHYNRLTSNPVIIGREIVVNNLAKDSLFRGSTILLKGGTFHSKFGRFLDQLIENNINITLLDEEGGIYGYNIVGLKNRMPRRLFDYIHHYYCWGEKQKEFIQSYGDVQTQLHLTGNPRFDFGTDYSKASLDYFSSKYLKEFHKDFVLINTSFSWTNYSPKDEKIVSWLSSKDNFNPHEIGKRYGYHNLLFYSFIEAIQELSAQFSEIRFVIRPHPSESPADYIKQLYKCKNIFVDSMRTVDAKYWIYKSRLLIHHDCTTGLEALMMGKPVISFSPFFHLDFTQYIPHQCSFKVESIEQLKESLVKILSNRSFQNIDTLFSNYHKYSGLIRESVYNLGRDTDTALVIAKSLSDQIVDPSSNSDIDKITQYIRNCNTKGNSNRLFRRYLNIFPKSNIAHENNKFPEKSNHLFIDYFRFINEYFKGNALIQELGDGLFTIQNETHEPI